MGNCVSTFKAAKKPKKAITLAIIGLDNAGKTSLCYVFTGEQPDSDLAPTVGFRNVRFAHSNFEVTLFDLGGGASIRPIWKTYLGELFGVLFVVDTSSPLRLSEAKQTFKDVMDHPQVSGKPVLVLANKVDKTEHMSEADVISGLSLDQVAKSSQSPTKLVMVSALQGVGSKMDKEIQKGLTWLFEEIRNSLSSLEPRVVEDMKNALEAKEKERSERKARVKKQREEREKAEEQERLKLGLTKQGSSDNEDDQDIIMGDPFKALDVEQLKKKEEKLKAESIQRKEKIKQLEQEELRKRFNPPIETGHEDDENIKQNTDPELTISSGLTLHLHNSLQGFSQRNQASSLPPLKSSTSLNQDDQSMVADSSNKKRRKKKKLTEYNRFIENKPKHDHFNVPKEEDGDQSLSPPESNLSTSRTDGSAITTRADSPKKINSIKYDETVEDIHVQKLHRERNSVLNEENIDSSSLGTFKTNQSLKSRTKLKGSNIDKDDDISQNETIFDGSNVDGRARLMQSSNVLDLNENSVIKLKRFSNKKGVQTYLLSDEDNSSYTPESPTLQKLSPSSLLEVRKSQTRAKDQSPRSNDFSPLEHHADLESRRNLVQRNKIKNKIQDNDKANSNHNAAKSPKSPVNSSQSSERNEELSSDHNMMSEKRHKKKHKFIRSNKVAPSDDEDPKSMSEDGLTPRKSESKIMPENDMTEKGSARNKNTRITPLNSKKDAGIKWGLADDLPSVDGGIRMPHFDHQDNDSPF